MLNNKWKALFTRERIFLWLLLALWLILYLLLNNHVLGSGR